MDNTLPDDAWKDSFDKLIEPERPILRQLNILKKNVRRSFNIDSSIENSNYSETASPSPSITNCLLNVPVPPFQVIALKRLAGSISTPLIAKQQPSCHLFRCPISPITDWHNSVETDEDPKQCNPPKVNFQATAISNDFDENSLPAVQALPKKRVCFDVDIDRFASEKDTRKRSSTETCKSKKNTRETQLTLQPGKWRKSLSNWRRRTHYTQQLDIETLPSLMKINNQIQASDTKSLDDSVEFVTITHFVGKRKSIFIKPERSSKPSKISLSVSAIGISCKKDVMKRCGQRKPIAFEKAYTRTEMTNCRKIGEGVYGEVFINKGIDHMEDTVLKIIPIEGSVEVNGEVQKTFEQILPEIIISSELSALRNLTNKGNSTNGFIELKKTKLVEGKYPDHLIRLWEKYNEEKTSENDHPDLFDKTQLYIVLELQFAGVDLATLEFVNAEQSYYALLQIILTLAIGEEVFQFEHRDLHWGNVLILNTDDKNIEFNIKNKLVTVPSKGLKVTIIDYTLSRITFNDVCLYNDLSNDEELFAASGDYQYDIYRMMRDVLKNNWLSFEPKTNVYWISYIIHKMFDGVHYKNVQTKIHKTYLNKFKNLQKTILNCNSAIDCAKYLKKIT